LAACPGRALLVSWGWIGWTFVQEWASVVVLRLDRVAMVGEVTVWLIYALYSLVARYQGLYLTVLFYDRVFLLRLVSFI
jgi:hypothetical protein